MLNDDAELSVEEVVDRPLIEALEQRASPVPDDRPRNDVA
jgi:hypothetical protein